MCVILVTEVGEYVDIRTFAKQVMIEKGGVAKSADFVAAGMRAVDVVNMCNAGADSSCEEQLLATLIPKGIVCVESALFHHRKLLRIFL